jgi:hypothetical protein
MDDTRARLALIHKVGRQGRKGGGDGDGDGNVDDTIKKSTFSNGSFVYTIDLRMGSSSRHPSGIEGPRKGRARHRDRQ